MTISNTQIWIVIAGLACGTYFLRLSFLALIGDRELPEWLLRHLRYTAVAIMPALIAPLIVWPSNSSDDVSLARILAAMLALLVGVWRANVMVTIIVGVLALLLLQYIGLN